MDFSRISDVNVCVLTFQDMYFSRISDVNEYMLTFQDVDKLQAEVEKVFRSLAYIKAVVEYQKPQVIPNTATVILENVMDVFTLLNNFFIAQDRYTAYL